MSMPTLLDQQPLQLPAGISASNSCNNCPLRQELQHCVMYDSASCLYIREFVLPDESHTMCMATAMQSGLTAQQLQQALAQGLMQGQQQPELQRYQPQLHCSVPSQRNVGVLLQHPNMQQLQQQAQEQDAALNHFHPDSTSVISMSGLPTQV
jgi:hypothetical protein